MFLSYLLCKYKTSLSLLLLLCYLVVWVVGHRHKRVSVNATVVGSIPIPENEIFNWVNFRHSTCNAVEFGGHYPPNGSLLYARYSVKLKKNMIFIYTLSIFNLYKNLKIASVFKENILCKEIITYGFISCDSFFLAIFFKLLIIISLLIVHQIYF